MNPIRAFIELNRALSNRFDSFLPHELTVDGNYDFVNSFALQFISSRSRIIDVGSGKRPFLSIQKKGEICAHVSGLDISSHELSMAPAGTYDQIVVADITEYQGDGAADLAICQALLEHVKDTRAAIRGISSAVKSDGTILVFVPSRNAVFARLNLVLPESLKRWILFKVFPHTKDAQGFKSYYDKCTPRDFRSIAAEHNLEVIALKPYFISSYFSFFFPLYVCWRIWIVLFRSLMGEQAAETFCVALRKK